MDSVIYDDFYEAYHFLDNHLLFKDKFMSEALFVEVVKVNPMTNEIDDNHVLNTKTQVWLECGGEEDDQFYHDINLDTGGDTFEEAIINLANLVVSHYGTYTAEERELAEQKWHNEAIEKAMERDN